MTGEVSKDSQLSAGSQTIIKLSDHCGYLLAEQDSFSTYSDELQTIHVFGQVRKYGQSEILSAKQLCELFQGDFAAFYASISGRFVIIIHSHTQNKLWIMNDHMASIPLFYCQDDKGFVISLSMKLIEQFAALPLKISSQAIYHYCYFHCIPSPLTIYQGVKKLSPAELICFENGKDSSHGTLYSPKFADQGGDTAEEKVRCLTEIENAVANSITDNCGAFLSGGLDSSTVAGMLAKLKNEALTFSVGFKEPGYDETEFALITAKHFNTKHDAVYLEPDYITENFANVASNFDEPFGNSSALAAYFCASYAKSQGVETLLAGDGGDELFAGNTRYAKQKLFAPYEKLPTFAKSLLKLIFIKTPLERLPLISKVASYIKQAENPLPDRLQAYNFLHRFPPTEIFTQEFLKDVDTTLPLKSLRERYRQVESSSQVDNMLFLDWKFTLADNDLIKVSKMCKLAGVEVRFPLIEKELVDFSCGIPASVKLPGQKLRHFFKEMVKPFLAPETLTKSKHGFGLPFGRWMRTTPKLVEITEGALSRLKSRGIVRSDFVDKALKMQSEEHSAYYGELIWILSVLELWMESRDA